MTKQITDYIHKRIKIICKDYVIFGKLCYYHFDNRTIHLSDYTKVTQNGKETGEFVVLNSNEWDSFKTKDIDLEQGE